jgi:hypothetical protein
VFIGLLCYWAVGIIGFNVYMGCLIACSVKRETEPKNQVISVPDFLEPNRN